MSSSTLSSADGNKNNFQVLWEDGERIFCRGFGNGIANHSAVLAVLPAAEHPTPATVDRLTREYGLKDELDEAWAVRPLELIREGGRTILVLEDAGGEPLERLVGAPMETASFLRLAISIVSALGKLHRRELVHKDIKPTNILVNRTTGEVKLTGFGLTSRIPRERQSPEPPETIAGTLAYMAPEQTGRMNRSIDSRSDLYALGVTLYQVLTAALPFTAADPMEWVHCHVARRPIAPAERSADVPSAVSDIILKLLAKTAEDRYQTAAGLEHDLRRCLADWEAKRAIDIFPLGEQDTPDRLLIPEKLYGREHEVETLLASFDRVVKSGAPELVLVSGYSGIGKSAVVNELHKVLVLSRGLFASGKFDQYKRDVPYATLAQAFRGLVRSLLSKPEAELGKWRGDLLEALGPNGALIVDLVPELTFVVGEQPLVPDLPPQEAKARFHLVLRRLIGVFARAEHPLALFLDDLQWLDAATLDLIEDLLRQPDVRNLMLVGAYRHNEVGSNHPLIRKMQTIRQNGAVVNELVLAPLSRDDLTQLVADSLRGYTRQVGPLADLIYEKTAGNPFFSIQFIQALTEEALLSFDRDKGQWRWDLNRIAAKSYTDNVIDLMVGRLSRLALKTRNALQKLACIGNTADVATLSIAHEMTEQEVAADLWEALRAELIVRSDNSYRFAHDRVHEAAYSLIPEEARQQAHLRIGRRLAANVPPDKRDEIIFEIVGQLNCGVPSITSREEREQLAEFNLVAGKRAKASSAYASALKYFKAGASLLAQDCWERRHELTFAFELHRAECEFLTGETAAATEHLTMLSSRAAGTVELATVACLHMNLFTILNQSDRAVTVCLDFLRHLGVEWSAHPTKEQAQREYERIWLQLGSRRIEELIDLPVMNDPASRATLDALTMVLLPAKFTDANLYCLAICWAVNLSLERGNSDGSCIPYASLGVIAGPHFGNYKAGFQFGQLGYELVEKRGLKRFQDRTYVIFGNHVMPWTKHVRASRDLLRQAFDAANKIGDLPYATVACENLNTNLLATGDPLVEVQREAESSLELAQSVRFGFAVDIIGLQLGLIRTLRGLTSRFGSFDDSQFDELRFERRLPNNPAMALPACCYWIRKLQARFSAGDYGAAIDASLKAQRLLWTLTSTFETAEYHFYSALSNAAVLDTAYPDGRTEHFEALVSHHRQLAEWAENCPANFENRTALVGAEIARVEGRELDAERLYDQAIGSAREHGFVHNEALASELAARFYRARGFEIIANAYLRVARHGYLRWGADGKVRQLDELYPHLGGERSASIPTGAILAPVEHLDLATVIKVSQSVSGEIVLEKLIDTLLRTALVQAGAGRGLLILCRDSEPRIAAEAATSGDAVIVHLRDEVVAEVLLPESVLHYVLRTRESVIIDDAATQSTFAADPYIREREARSILCLPLITQAKLIGVLYLENNLTPYVFAPARIAVLKLVASQAAIALENSRLYSDVQEREAKIRRLVDANIIGILIFDLEGRIIEANDAFLRMVGYDREDLVSGRMRWTDLTPSEWRDCSAQAVEEVKITGIARPYEKEYFRKDGSRVPVLIGSASFEETGDQGVGFVVDLTERKRAEEAFRELASDLAHMNRLSMMGGLVASLAHEITQPIAAVRNDALAARNFLKMQPPDLGEVEEALSCVVSDADRAGEIIDRIREQIKKAPPRKERFDLNAAINEVIILARSVTNRNGVSVQIRLADGLFPVKGDRVQLQQVLLNLILNAVEAMGSVEADTRELLVSTEQDHTGVLVVVRDSGPGIDQTHLKRVFEAFYTTKSSGMGMGLSICRTIIDDHGGKLWAEANEPRGAVFQFTLPGAEENCGRGPSSGEPARS